MNAKDIARLVSKIDFNDSEPDGCWEWVGATTPRGYGQLMVAGHNIAVHRAAFALWYGPVSSKTVLRHTCDNPICVRPDHLIPGTHQDNADDMVARNRQAKGESAGRSRLTVAQVVDIREKYATGEVTHRHLASEFGITRGTVGRIVTGRLWKHVPGALTNDAASALAQEHQAKGETSGRHQFTDVQIVDIRRRYASGRVSQTDLADEYGVSSVAINRIVRRKTWKHIN